MELNLYALKAMGKSSPSLLFFLLSLFDNTLVRCIGRIWTDENC